jgi:hypothetical protein
MSQAQSQLPPLSLTDQQILTYLRAKASYYQSLLHKTSEQDQEHIHQILESIQISSKLLIEQQLTGPAKISFRTKVLDIENYCLRDIFNFMLFSTCFLDLLLLFR